MSRSPLAARTSTPHWKRLGDQASQHQWDLVVGLTELPLRDDEDGRYLLIETDPQRGTAVLSLPALGGLRMHALTRHAVRSLVDGMADPTSEDEHGVPLPRLSGSTVWLLAGSSSWWRLLVATIASIALVVAWLVIDGALWDRPDDNSSEARERSRLYNTSTVVTLTTGVIVCYLALYLVKLLWALFVLDPAVMGVPARITRLRRPVRTRLVRGICRNRRRRPRHRDASSQ